MLPVRSFVRRVGVLGIDLAPGEYVATPGGTYWATVRCPDCLTITATPRRVFSVDVWGRVSPVVICPGAGCKFMACIQFEDWVPEPSGSA